MKLNKYNMEHNWLTGFRTGQLFVTMMQDVTPGEIWYGRSTNIVRLDPLNKPTFMSLKIFTRKFFVPYRILDPDFPDYWTGQNDSHVLPTMNTGFNNVLSTDVMLMLGIPLTQNRADNFVSAYPLMAYNKIWNDHFRQSEINEVALNYEGIHRVSHPTNTYHGRIRSDMQLGAAEVIPTTPDLTVPNVRDSWARQRLQEHRLIYGDKYTDQLKRFGVNAPAGLVDEAVPIASGRGVMGISEVVETATTAESNSGQMTGHGIVTFGSQLKPRKFVEPGIIMEVAYARPRLSLLTPISRIFNKKEDDETSFYQPEYAVQSDAIVKSDEIYALSTPTNTNYGYIDNYEWLRSSVDVVAGRITQTDYQEYSAHKRLSAVPTIDHLQYVDDYDQLFQNGAATSRADLQFYTAHRLQKLSPIRRKGRS